MRTVSTLAAAAAAALALAACSSSPPPSTSDNVRVCQHYRTQRAWVKSLTMPTIADALKWEGWVGVDAEEATPGTQLRRDLATMYADMQHTRDLYAISARVMNDCEALGVTFQP